MNLNKSFAAVACLLGILGTGSGAWGASPEKKILVAWGMVSEPAVLAAPVTVDDEVEEEQRETILGLKEAIDLAQRARQEAVNALRSFEMARRRAQDAEDRRLALEQDIRHQSELARLREQAECEQVSYYGGVEGVELAKLRERAAREQARAQREAEAAELAKLRRLAAQELLLAQQEREAAELSKLRQEAAREQLAYYGSEEAVDLARLRERAAREQALARQDQEAAELARLRAQAARERIEFYGSQEAADLARRKEQEAADLAKLREKVARERLEYYGSEEAAELGRLREQAERERQAAEAEKRRREEERKKSFLPMEQSRLPGKPLLLAALREAAVASDVLPEIYVYVDTPAADRSPVAERISTPAEATGSAGYIIGPGDELTISVWRDEALSRTIRVSPDGTFSFPLVGDVPAAGRTLPELKKEMEQRLAVYVAEPVVTVEMKQADSMTIYIIGKVNSPGRFQIFSHINVLQALAMAGGLNPFADEDDIKILRENTTGETLTFAFDYDEVLQGERLDQNIRLQRGDIVVVP